MNRKNIKYLKRILYYRLKIMYNNLFEILNLFISLFNDCILHFFIFLYNWCKFETLEDKHHKYKKDNKIWNKVKFEFNKNDEFNIVKNNLLDIIKNEDFLKKYDITTESIINNTNNKLAVSFTENCIYIYFNHYYVSGPNMFIFLNNLVSSSPPKFLKTNPFLGLLNMPFYLYDLFLLQKKEYNKTEKLKEDLIIEKKITSTQNKRCYSYLSILKKIYHSLQMNRPMVVALSLAFDDLPYITNNVGLIIIKYEIKDTVETLENKLKNAYYQAYCSNFIINCPLPNIGNFELRDYIDCIISSMYIKSDYDFKVAWNCSKSPTEQIYVGSTSIIHSDNTMDINMCFNTCSSNYKDSFDKNESEINYTYIDNYFEESIDLKKEQNIIVKMN